MNGIPVLFIWINHVDVTWYVSVHNVERQIISSSFRYESNMSNIWIVERCLPNVVRVFDILQTLSKVFKFQAKFLDN
jgi:hypothetical protein